MLVVEPRGIKPLLGVFSLSGRLTYSCPTSPNTTFSQLLSYHLNRAKTWKLQSAAVTVTHCNPYIRSQTIKRLKQLSVPIIPLHHLETHFSFYQQYPFLALVATSTNTELVFVKGLGDYEIIGMSIDIGVGKAIQILGNEFGMQLEDMENLALSGQTDWINVPVPMQTAKSPDFSFLGPVNRALQRNLHPSSPLLEPHFLPQDTTVAAPLFHAFYQAIGLHIRTQVQKGLNLLQNKESRPTALVTVIQVFCGGASKSKVLCMHLEAVCQENKLKLEMLPSNECTDNVFQLGRSALAYYHSGKYVDLASECIVLNGFVMDNSTVSVLNVTPCEHHCKCKQVWFNLGLRANLTRTYSEFQELHKHISERLKLAPVASVLPKFPRKCWTEVFRYVCTKKRGQKLLIWLNAILKVQEAYPYAIFFLDVNPEATHKTERISNTEKQLPVFDMLEELVHLFTQAEDEDRRPVIISKVLDLLNSSQSLCDVLFELGSDRFQRLRLEIPVLSLSHTPDFYAAMELLKVLYPHLLQQSESNLLHVLNQSQQAANIFTCWMMEGSTMTQSFTQDLAQWKTLACPGHEEYLSIKYRFIEKDVDFLVELYVNASQTRMLSAVTSPIERMLWDYRAAEIVNLRVISEDSWVQRIQYHMNNRTCDFFIQLIITRPSEDRVVVTHTFTDPASTSLRSLGNSCSYIIDRVSPQSTFLNSSNSLISPPPSATTGPMDRCKLTYFVHHDSEVKQMFVPDFLGETGDFRKAWIKLKAYLERGDKRDLGEEFGSMSQAVAMKTLRSPTRKLNPPPENRIMHSFWTHKEGHFATERI